MKGENVMKIIERKIKILSLVMVFFVAALIFPTGFFLSAEKVREANEAYAEELIENSSSIQGDDLIESIATNPLFEDAVESTDEYIDKDFDIDEVIDEDAKVTESEGVDGSTYEIATVENLDGSRIVTLTSNKDDLVREINLNLDEETFKLTNYELVEKGADDYIVTSVNVDLSEVEIQEDANPVQVAGGKLFN
jgi:hypothetical protein